MVVTSITGLGYIVLLGWLIFGKNRRLSKSWGTIYCLWSLVLIGSQLYTLQPDLVASSQLGGQVALLRPTLVIAEGYAPTFLLQASAYLISLGLLSTLTVSQLNWRGGWFWSVLGVAAVGGILAAAQLGRLPLPVNLTGDPWYVAVRQPPAQLPVALAAVWGLVMVVLVLVTVMELNKVQLPLHANRLMWWLIVLPIIGLGELLMLWASEPYSSIGMGIRWLGTLVLVYSVSSPLLFSLRNFFRASMGTAVLVLLTVLIMLVGLGSSAYFYFNLPQNQAFGAIIATLVGLALAYQFLRKKTEQVVARIVLLSSYDTAEIVAELSSRTANLLEIDQLTEAVAELLHEAVDVERVRLLTLTPSDANYLRADVYAPADEEPPAALDILKNSPFLWTLDATRAPVLQYSLDIEPEYKKMVDEERKWLKDLGIDAYFPMFDDQFLSGLLAIGPRTSGDPYRTRELELFKALANQTAVALKNARLFSQQRQLTAEMVVLNEHLQATNARMAQIDSVKSDFITISSHELRTPLTQLRGYADIMETMSSKNMLKIEQVSNIASSMLKACDRLNDVISKMLEVAQIDVDALTLHHAEAKTDELIQKAIDPMAAALEERKIDLTVSELDNLPTMQVDRSRITKAFGQVISNAVKFTPDGGKIEITGRHLPGKNKRPESIEVVVRDSGIGIDASHHDLIFDKFFRVGDTNVHSTSDTSFLGAGPGLGLTIAKGVIVAHGGSIRVESPGHDMEKFPGSTFYITLPLQPPETLPATGPLDAEAVLSVAFTESTDGSNR